MNTLKKWLVGGLVLAGAAVVTFTLGSCGPDARQAGLNLRNRDLGEALAKYPDPVVAAPGAEVAANADTLASTCFRDLATPADVPATPEAAKVQREAVRQAQEARDATVTAAKSILGSLPWGSALLGGLPTIAAVIAWLRSAGRAKLATAALKATASAVDAYRDGGAKAALESVVNDPAVREAAAEKARDALRGLLEKAQASDPRIKALVEKALAELRAAAPA
jgi:hypothetical protein